MKFTNKVMPVTAPLLWDEFYQFLQERGFDLAVAVAKSLGSQHDYETQSTFSTAKERFDLYLSGKITE